MKRILLLTVLLFIGFASSAQTYVNPPQSSNSKTVKVSKVEKFANYTMVYLKYSSPTSNSAGMINAYPTLTDQATGKKYKATAAMNFKWGTKYAGNVTFKIKFPPLPASATKLTFREADVVEGSWIIKNITLTQASTQNTTQSKQTTAKKQTATTAKKQTTAKRQTATKQNTTAQKQTTAKKTSSPNIQTVDGKTTYTNPRQSPKRSWYKVTKVIRTKTSTVVHFYISQGGSVYTEFVELIDEDTNKKYKARKALNFIDSYDYPNANTYKIEFPPLPRSVSEVTFKSFEKEVYNIQLPPPAEPKPKNNSGNKTVIINM